MPPPDEIKAARFTPEMLKTATFMRGKGCKNCNGTGYRGRKGIFEMLAMNAKLREMTFNREPTQVIRKVARRILEAMQFEITEAEDGAQALGYLKRFGSVTVLNGHIHQIMQKVEGNITFHTARSTAFPQPAPGVGPGPGPVKVPVEELPGMLGVREVSYVVGRSTLAVVDTALGSGER